MKKTLIVVTLLFCSSYSFAQSTDSHKKKPAIFIDSIRVAQDYFSHLSPDNIASVDVKRSNEFPDGVIYITSKSKEQTQNLLKSPLLSLKDIVNKYVPGEQKRRPTIFLLDGKMLTDTVNVRLPAVAVRMVNVLRAEDTPYFKTGIPNVLILMIHTRIEISIRGTSEKEEMIKLLKR